MTLPPREFHGAGRAGDRIERLGSVSNSPPGNWIRDTIQVSGSVGYTRGKHPLVAGVEYFRRSGSLALSDRSRMPELDR